jgi:hypothetical protein
VDSSTGVATCSTSSLSAQGTPHPITAIYSGDPSFSGSTSNTVNQQVNNSTTVLATSGSTSVFGQTVTFTATVSGASPPTGTMKFQDNAVDIGSCTAQPVNTGTGVATCTISSLSAQGTAHPITAIYSGDSSLTGSTSNIVNQVVNKASTTTVVMTSIGQGGAGTPITFQATVSASTASGSPTGNVTFKSDGATIIGNKSDAQPVALVASGDNQTSKASFTTQPPDISVGTRVITAVYNGDSNYLTSTSAGHSQVINGAPPSPAGATATTIIGGANIGVANQGKIFIAGGNAQAASTMAPTSATWI